MPAPIRQTPDGCKPALVSKFFSRRVERLDDSVGKENQRVARPQLQGGSFVSRIHFDSERKPSDFELLKRAVRPAQNRRIEKLEIGGLDRKSTRLNSSHVAIS